MDTLNNNIYSDLHYIQYQKEYFKNSKFTEIILKGIDNLNNNIVCPLTIQEDQNEKNLNYYNNPINLDDLGLNLLSYNNIIEEIKKIAKKENVDSILLKKKINEKILKEQLNENKDKIDFIGIESTIKLDQDLESIERKFSKGHRSALKIDYKNKYELD